MNFEEALARIDYDPDIFPETAQRSVNQHGPDRGDAAAFEATTAVEAMGETVNVTWAVQTYTKLDTERHRLLAALRHLLKEGPST